MSLYIVLYVSVIILSIKSQQDFDSLGEIQQ